MEHDRAAFAQEGTDSSVTIYVRLTKVFGFAIDWQERPLMLMIGPVVIEFGDYAW